MSKRTGFMSVAAIACITIALLAGTCLQAEAAERSSRSKQSFRGDIQSVIDDTRTLMSHAPVPSGLIDDLDQVDGYIDEIPDAELENIPPALGEEMERLRGLMADLVELVESSPGGSETMDAVDWPEAIYPSLEWSFVVTGNTNPDSGAPGEGNSASEGGYCSHANALTPEGKVIAYNIVLAFEAVRDAASWICQAAPLGEPFCIITDIAYIAAHGVVDNMFLCYDLMMEAEITGTYNRLDHFHDDLIAMQSDISGRIDTMELVVIANIDVNEELILDIDSDLVAHDINMETRTDEIADKIAGLTQFIVDFRAEDMRIQIENSLADADNKTVGTFQMPAALGGHLELVHAVVVDTIARLEAAGQTVGNASSILARGVSYYAEEDWARAYTEFASAYRTAAR